MLLAHGPGLREDHIRLPSWSKSLHSPTVTNLLCNSATLGDPVRKAVRVVLPKVLLPAFEGMLAVGMMQFPHEASVSRWRMLLDEAFMLHQQKLLSCDNQGHISVLGRIP